MIVLEDRTAACQKLSKSGCTHVVTHGVSSPEPTTGPDYYLGADELTKIIGMGVIN